MRVARFNLAIAVALTLASITGIALGLACFNKRVLWDAAPGNRSLVIIVGHQGYWVFIVLRWPSAERIAGAHQKEIAQYRQEWREDGLVRPETPRGFQYRRSPYTVLAFGKSGFVRSPVPFTPWIFGTLLVVPFWLPSVLLLVYPGIYFIRGPVRRYLRYRRGLCPHCGYNLTGNVSGICPECGTGISTNVSRRLKRSGGPD